MRDEFNFTIVEIELDSGHTLHAGANNISVARAAFERLCEIYKDRRLMLMHGGYISAKHEPRAPPAAPLSS